MRKELLKRKILNTGALCISFFKLIPDWFKLGHNSIVLDCGANVGHITRLFASTGATVIAFEPDPVAFKQLSKRCKKRKNVILIQKGVWDKNSIIKLYTHKETTGNEPSFTVGSSIVAEKINVSVENFQPIEVIDLVEYMQSQKRRINLVKLDVEGAEIAILKRILETNAWHLFDRMYVETHETKIPSQLEDLEWIKQQLKEKKIMHIKLNWV